MTLGAGGRGVPAEIDLLDVGGEMRFVTLEALPVVARALAVAGWVVIVGHEEGSERLAFRGAARRLRCAAGGAEDSGGAEDAGDSGGTGAKAEVERDDALVPEMEESATREEGAGDGSGGDVGAGGRAGAARASRRPVYQDEMSERRARGAVTLSSGGWWTATLSVPVEAGAPLTYVRMERCVAGEEESADFAVPAAEVDAVLVLLEGVVAQARRDGVLPPPVSGEASSRAGERS